jgi:hypothetical protein
MVAVPLASLLAFASTAALLDRARWLPARTALSPDEEAEVLGALVDFHRVYEDFFATGGRPDLLDAVPATTAAKHQVFRDLGFVRDAGLVLVQDLARATVLEAHATGPDAAEVVVFEEWNYEFQRAADRTAVAGAKGLGQGFRYRLRREGGRWLVAGWDPEDVPAPEGAAGAAP